MPKQKTERVDLRVSAEDKRMVQEIANKLNVSESAVWRIAIKYYYDNEMKKPR